MISRNTISGKLTSFVPEVSPRDQRLFSHNERAKPVAAAVLIPIISRESGLSILLTKRNKHLKVHAGQVSFPGGKVSASDTDREETALREMLEETGISVSRPNVIGVLPEYDIRTGFRVSPFVGWIDYPFTAKPDRGEVEAIFEVPFELILDTNNYVLESRFIDDEQHHFYRLPYKPYNIWGATAGILHTLAVALK